MRDVSGSRLLGSHSRSLVGPRRTRSASRGNTRGHAEASLAPGYLATPWLLDYFLIYIDRSHGRLRKMSFSLCISP